MAGTPNRHGEHSCDIVRNFFFKYLKGSKSQMAVGYWLPTECLQESVEVNMKSNVYSKGSNSK